jgi:hypothetical protein
MGLIIGPTPWWQSDLVAETPESGALPDGSRIICKAGGTAWIVAPACTQVGQTWNGNTNTLVGNQCCLSSWATLCSKMISCGFNPDDWFIPSISQLQNPGYVCRTNWDSFSARRYWSSTEFSNTCACNQPFVDGCSIAYCKVLSQCVRAFRCVTY